MDTSHHDDLDPVLSAAVQGLRDREPEHDLWPAIAPWLQSRRSGMLQLHWPVALAAGFALVVATAGVTTLLNQRTPDAAPVVAVDNTQRTGTSGVLPAGFGAANATLDGAIAQLEAAVAQVAPDLDPVARQRIAASVAALDSAIADARRQTGAAPDDVGAARYLTRTMQRKLDVLQSVASMTRRT